MYIFNTKPYNPVGFRETFDGLITFFGICPVHNDKLYPNDYTFTDGDRRAFFPFKDGSIFFNFLLSIILTSLTPLLIAFLFSLV